MKYVAVCVLSIATMLSASASPSAQPSSLFGPSLIEPAVRAASLAQDAAGDGVTGSGDSTLMTLLGGALVALQLRRRQKSLRSPRLTSSS